MAQQQIQGDTGTVDGNGAFVTYKVPGSVVATPYSVSVSVDGSGASGNFLPCLSFYTIAGKLIARAPAPEVASGDTGEVSWFPHVAAAAAQTVSGGIPWATQSLPSSTVTVLSGGHAEFGSSTPVDHFYTNAPSVFAYAENTDYSLYGIQVLTAGHFMIDASVSVLTFGAGAIDLTLGIAEGPSDVSAGGPYGLTEVLSSTPIYGDESNNVIITFRHVGQVTSGSVSPPAPPIVWYVNNYGANTATLSANSYTIMQLDAVDSTIA